MPKRAKVDILPLLKKINLHQDAEDDSGAPQEARRYTSIEIAQGDCFVRVKLPSTFFDVRESFILAKIVHILEDAARAINETPEAMGRRVADDWVNNIDVVKLRERRKRLPMTQKVLAEQWCHMSERVYSDIERLGKARTYHFDAIVRYFQSVDRAFTPAAILKTR